MSLGDDDSCRSMRPEVGQLCDRWTVADARCWREDSMLYRSGRPFRDRAAYGRSSTDVGAHGKTRLT